VHALAALIRSQADRHSRLLCAGAKEPAWPLGQALRDDGFQVVEAALYETRMLMPAIATADLARIGHILVHSPRAGRAIAGMLMAHHDKLSFPKLRFICISEAAWQGVETTLHDSPVPEIADAVTAGLNRRVAATPDEAAMLDLLD